jgi:DNA-binding NarL/FixJ family response regulator
VEARRQGTAQDGAEHVVDVTTTRILVVDDHPAVASGLRAIFDAEADFDVVGVERTVGAGVIATRRLQPRVVLLDLNLPDARGVRAVALVRAAHPDVAILVLSAQLDAATAQACVDAGALGYLLKTSSPQTLVAAVRDVAAGERVTDPLVDRDVGAGDLTARELEVLQAVSEGLTNRQVAARLGVAQDTVKTHLSRAMTKLGAADRTHAVAVLLRRGLLH